MTEVTAKTTAKMSAATVNVTMPIKRVASTRSPTRQPSSLERIGPTTVDSEGPDDPLPVSNPADDADDDGCRARPPNVSVVDAWAVVWAAEPNWAEPNWAELLWAELPWPNEYWDGSELAEVTIAGPFAKDR